MLHELKTNTEVFTQTYNGLKNFEVRENDRGFKESDILLLREIKSLKFSEFYTGREIICKVNYVLHKESYGLKNNWVVMDIKVLHRLSTPFSKYQKIAYNIWAATRTRSSENLLEEIEKIVTILKVNDYQRV